MLKGAALIWWNIYVSSTEAAVIAKLSWEEFKRKVLEEFCNERAMGTGGRVPEPKEREWKRKGLQPTLHRETWFSGTRGPHRKEED